MIDLAPPRRAAGAASRLLAGLLALALPATAQETAPVKPGDRPDAPPAPKVEAPAAAASPGKQGADALEEFAKTVRARHWAADRKEAVDRFRARFAVNSNTGGGPQGAPAARVSIPLDIQFVAPGFLRIRYSEQDTIIEQGWDQRGPWLRKTQNGRSTEIDLTRAGSQGKDLARDRDELKRYRRVVRQLVSFLDPAAALRALELEKAPAKTELQLGRVKKQVTRVSGLLPRFPFASNIDGETALHRAAVQFHFDEENTLLAVRAVAVDEKLRALAPAEWTMMGAHEYSDGVLLPTRLTVYREIPRPMGQPPRRPQTLAEVRITDVNFDSSLKPEHLARGVQSSSR